jgi:primosomal protein N' (replication factor Y)
VVVGTQAAFGHGLRARLVVVVDADSLELAPRYGAAEEALWLMAQAAAIAGPRRDGGRVLAQTHRTRSPAVQALVLGDSTRLDEAEGAARAAALLPPFGDTLLVTGPEALLEAVGADLPGGPSILDDGRLILSAADLDPWRAPLRAAIDRHRKTGDRVRVETDPSL